jgi:hypothetical protein
MRPQVCQWLTDEYLAGWSRWMEPLDGAAGWSRWMEPLWAESPAWFFEPRDGAAGWKGWMEGMDKVAK